MQMSKNQVLMDAEEWARRGEVVSTTMEREPNTTEEQENQYEEHLDRAAALARRAAAVGVKDPDCVALVAAILIERDTGWAPTRIAAEAKCLQQLGALERHVLAASINSSQFVLAILTGNGAATDSSLVQTDFQNTASAAAGRSPVEMHDGLARRTLKLRRVTESGVLARKLG